MYDKHKNKPDKLTDLAKGYFWGTVIGFVILVGTAIVVTIW